MARRNKKGNNGEGIATAEVFSLPVLPVKNTVLFPQMLLPLSVGRPGSLAAVEAALQSENKELIVVAQKDPNVEQPTFDDLYKIGTRAVIKNVARSENVLEILVQGLDRVTILKAEQAEPYLRVEACVLPLPEKDDSAEFEALRRAIVDLGRRAFELAHPEGRIHLDQVAAQTDEPLKVFFFLSSVLGLDYAKQQRLLEAKTRLEAARLLHQFLTHEVQVLELRQKIAAQARSEMSQEPTDLRQLRDRDRDPRRVVEAPPARRAITLDGRRLRHTSPKSSVSTAEAPTHGLGARAFLGGLEIPWR